MTSSSSSWTPIRDLEGVGERRDEELDRGVAVGGEGSRVGPAQQSRPMLL
jgi:hypothetical protein